MKTRMTTLPDKTYDHVVRTLMNIPSGCETELCFKQNAIASAHDLASLTENDINQLTYKEVDKNGDPTGNTLDIPVFRRSSIRHMCNYLRLLSSMNNNKLTEKIITDITIDDWNEYRIMAPTKSNSTFNSLATSNSTQSLELQNFNKGIKRDKLQYPTIKDVRHFFTWQKSFIGVARTHNIDDVFNPSYVAHTVEEKEVFAAKQKFAFSVLDHTLHIMVIMMHKRCANILWRMPSHQQRHKSPLRKSWPG
jgi:hypothetical protein